MNNETMVYYPLTDTWETAPAATAADDKVEPKGATAAPKPQDSKA